MQKGEQSFFREYSLEEATSFFREQAERGDWGDRLKAVYVIGILNFTFDDGDTSYYHHEVCLVDKYTGKAFCNKLTFTYLEMPKFNKSEEELKGMFDK